MKGFILITAVLVFFTSCSSPLYRVGNSTADASFRIEAPLGLTSSGSSRFLVPEMAGNPIKISLVRRDMNKVLHEEELILTLDPLTSTLSAQTVLQVPLGTDLTLTVTYTESGTVLSRAVHNFNLFGPLDQPMKINLLPTADFPGLETLGLGTTLPSLSIPPGVSKVLRFELDSSHVRNGVILKWTSGQDTSSLLFSVRGPTGEIIKFSEATTFVGLSFTPSSPGLHYLILHNKSVDPQVELTVDLTNLLIPLNLYYYGNEATAGTLPPVLTDMSSYSSPAHWQPGTLWNARAIFLPPGIQNPTAVGLPITQENQSYWGPPTWNCGPSGPPVIEFPW